MTITKKPSTVEKFISKAKADMNRAVVKKRKHATQKKASGKTKQMTFYMTPEMYLSWQKYKLEQLAAGNQISFQGTVEKYLKNILA